MYAGNPDLFGLILYFNEFSEPAEIAKNLNAVKLRCVPFLNKEYGVTEETLRIFPIAARIMKELRATPRWCFQAHTEIDHPLDTQLFFSGRTEQELEQYFRDKGLIDERTKQGHKGF